MTGQLALIGRLDGPQAVPRSVVQSCRTYREAVRMAWAMKRVHAMTKQQLAGEAGLYASHVSDYLAADDKPSRRDLPAHKVAEFEGVVGNRLVSQWLAARSELTVMEEWQLERAAA